MKNKNWNHVEIHLLTIGSPFNFDEPSIHNPEYPNQLIKLYNGGRFKYRRLEAGKNSYSDLYGSGKFKKVYAAIAGSLPKGETKDFFGTTVENR